ncbi:recombination mediator RecR [Thermaurantiacus sp.]
MATPHATGADELEIAQAMLARLPGLGPRSARRALLHLLKHRERLLTPLVDALARVAAALGECPECGNLDVVSPCRICTDPRRDPTLLCVVADVADVWALDRARLFPGRFHVLGGLLSALDGVGPEDLSIPRLLTRLDGVTEVVLAMNATLEGQTTAHHVAARLAGLPVKVSQLAHGVPVGGELDHLDEGTLAQALRLRRPL